jgi:hypothetical protein
MATKPGIPGRDPSLEGEGVPDLEGPLPAKIATGDPQEGVAPPGDRPVGSFDFGVTRDEEHRAEPLDLRITREEPDFDDDPSRDALDPDENPAVGRIVEPESNVDELDLTEDSVAFDVGPDDGVFAPEESAMHIVPDDEVDADDL